MMKFIRPQKNRPITPPNKYLRMKDVARENICGILLEGSERLRMSEMKNVSLAIYSRLKSESDVARRASATAGIHRDRIISKM